MSTAGRHLRTVLTLSLSAALVDSVAGAGSSGPAETSWLDRPLSNWNRAGGAVPRAPAREAEPPAASGCARQTRPPGSPEDRAVTAAGWTLFGPRQSFGETTVVQGLSGFDGMCRPLGYQAFVFVGRLFAGTLAPAPMNAGTDGAAGRTGLDEPARLVAEFARHRAGDPLCCPFRLDAVAYRIARDEAGPVLLPAEVVRGEGGSARLKYPEARRAEVVDDYHGTRVADPFRWLEDAAAPETVAWVEAQNALTRSFLDGPEREAIRKRLLELYDYPRVSVPRRHGSRYFYQRNTGLQNQSVLYVREGPDGPERVLLDPNTLSEDGTVALTAFDATRDGALMAYALSRSGSDRREVYVRDVATGKDLPDRLLWVKFSGFSWTPDNEGFYYTRYPEPGTVPPGDENYYGRVYFHRIGDPQEKDRLVYERPEEKEITHAGKVTRDGRFLVLTSFKGSSGRSEVRVLDRTRPSAKPVPIFTGFTDRVVFVDEVDGRFYFQTDREAPLGRVVAVDVGRGRTRPVEVLPEGKDTLEDVAIVDRKIVAVRLRDATSRVDLHALGGAPLGAVELPALGSVAGVTGEPEDREMFLGFTSFTFPTTPYRYDFEAGRLEPFEKVSARADGAAYDVEQVFYASRDGTRVPMFLVHKRGLPRDGRRPTVLSAYGGFNISITPSYNPARFLWLEREGLLAIPNLRGGGEYGEAWHQAGMLERKQNVFDDFIAAAEWLVANGYTRPDKLAIQGGSNGGLLVGAAMTQRPDLFGAVVCQVPVADMLRYHLFTVGRFWIPEYGSSEDPKQFAFLYRYSPYHNVRDVVAYPPTLVTTADTDDRVAPGMAKKFAARLQAATDGTRPMLIRIETKAGHGGGKPVSKQLEEQADIYRFLSRVLDPEG
jgi:prolyl oligopeptidase